MSEQHDTVSSPNEFMGSQPVSAGKDDPSPYAFFGANQGLPFRYVVSIVPQSGQGTGVLFDVSGVINPSGFGCLEHGTEIIDP